MYSGLPGKLYLYRLDYPGEKNKVKVSLWGLLPSSSNTAIGCCLVVFSEEPQKEEEEEEEPLAGKDDEERRIAEMGRPMLGDHVKLEVIIEESYEFKVRPGVFLCIRGRIIGSYSIGYQSGRDGRSTFFNVQSAQACLWVLGYFW